MSLRHRHVWRIVGQRTRPPAAEFEFSGGFWSEGASDAQYGYTILSLRCEECGDVATRKLRGEFVDGEGSE